MRSFKDLEPLLARIRLEKKVQFLSDDLVKQATNADPKAAQPAGSDGQKKQLDPAEPSKR